MHSPLLRLNVVPRSNVPLTIDHCCGMIALSISPLIGYYQATVSFVLCKLNKRGGEGRRRNERKRGRSYDAKGRRIVGEEWRQLDRIQYKTTNASSTPSNHHPREFIMVDASIWENGYSLLFLSPVYVTDRIFFLFFFFPSIWHRELPGNWWTMKTAVLFSPRIPQGSVQPRKKMEFVRPHRYTRILFPVRGYCVGYCLYLNDIYGNIEIQNSMEKEKLPFVAIFKQV